MINIGWRFILLDYNTSDFNITISKLMPFSSSVLTATQDEGKQLNELLYSRLSVLKTNKFNAMPTKNHNLCIVEIEPKHYLYMIFGTKLLIKVNKQYYYYIGHMEADRHLSIILETKTRKRIWEIINFVHQFSTILNLITVSLTSYYFFKCSTYNRYKLEFKYFYEKLL